MVITYQGNLISAVFHSTSSGTTENAKDVWGGDIPYLKSVDSSVDKDSPKYFSDYSINLTEFQNILKNNYPDIDFDNKLVSDVLHSEGGSVKSIKIYNKLLSGNDIRNIFNLQSSNFNIEQKDNSIYFKVYGYDQCVRMSQYDANFLAKKGYNYKDILLHYYTDVEIK